MLSLLHQCFRLLHLVLQGAAFAIAVFMRVIRIRDFARLREADEEVLIRYLNNPSPSTVMIFAADELDKRKKSSKVLLDCP